LILILPHPARHADHQALRNVPGTLQLLMLGDIGQHDNGHRALENHRYSYARPIAREYADTHGFTFWDWSSLPFDLMVNRMWDELLHNNAMAVARKRFIKNEGWHEIYNKLAVFVCPVWAMRDYLSDDKAGLMDITYHTNLAAFERETKTLRPHYDVVHRVETVAELREAITAEMAERDAATDPDAEPKDVDAGDAGDAEWIGDETYPEAAGPL